MDSTQAWIERGRPAHVAIIMDGNGRWARSRGLPRSAGHSRGAEALRRAVRAALELGLDCLTVFAFSSENWYRPAREVDGLMGLLRHYLKGEIGELHGNGVRLRFIGARERLPADIISLIDESEARTRDNGQLTLVVALSYGGRQEFVAAARRLAAAAAAGRLDPDKIDEDQVAAALFTAGLPDPDLVIRTSGERRISNFLLWQTAYSELVFLDKFWPDFDKSDLEAAILEYQKRQRRYGVLEEAG
jgi:undecaprenyl diphosphate synthase